MSDSESSEQKARDRIDRSFDDYRKSGLALMATVIALSSGGIAGLFQITGTKNLALLYFIPIALAVLQQLAHYLASKANAHSDFERLYEIPDPEDDAAHMEARIGARIYFMQAQVHFAIADILSWLACSVLGLVSLYPLLILASAGISIAVVSTVVAVMGYWAWRWKKLQKEIDKIDW